MFIIPQITPPFATVEQAFAGRPAVQDLDVRQADIDAVYDGFDHAAPGERVDFVHLGCPHASFEEMREYARLFAGRTAASGVELWITTSRAVRALADQEGITPALRSSGAKIITDTCPMSCHFARTTSPDPDIELPPPPMRVMVVDSAKQAKYVRDMIRCKTLLTSTAAAVETAVTGRFVPRHAA
jgi:predicted aconitase